MNVQESLDSVTNRKCLIWCLAVLHGLFFLDSNFLLFLENFISCLNLVMKLNKRKKAVFEHGVLPNLRFLPFTSEIESRRRSRDGSCLQQVRVHEAVVSEKSAAKNWKSDSAKAQANCYRHQRGGPENGDSANHQGAMPKMREQFSVRLAGANARWRRSFNPVYALHKM